jgi:hypothetical protein
MNSDRRRESWKKREGREKDIGRKGKRKEEGVREKW